MSGKTRSQFSELQSMIDELDILRRRAEAGGHAFLSHLLAISAIEASVTLQDARKLSLVITDLDTSGDGR